jgi:DnaJ-class molecular chaperone
MYNRWKTRSPDDEAFHGLPYGDPPEVWEDCPDCCGEGAIDHPRPFHDDPYFCIVVACDTCHGAGGMICEATGDR